MEQPNGGFIIYPDDDASSQLEEEPGTEKNIQEEPIICGPQGAKKLFLNEGLFIFRSLHQISDALMDQYSLEIPFDVITHIVQFYADSLIAEVNLVMEEDTNWFDTKLENLREGFQRLLNIFFRVDIYGTVSGNCMFESQDRYFSGSFNGNGEFKIYTRFDMTQKGDFNEIREYAGHVNLNSDVYFIMTNKIMKTLSTNYLHSSKIMKGKGTMKKIATPKPTLNPQYEFF